MSIEESLLGNSQFLGRDGFRWWIGQVAPRKAQADQTDDGEGWSYRYKVRIMGYHPFSTIELEDEEYTALREDLAAQIINDTDKTK